MTQFIALILVAQATIATELPRRSLLKGGLLAWLGGVTKTAPASPAPVLVEIEAAFAQRLRQTQLIAQALGKPVQTWRFDELTGTDFLIHRIRQNPEVAIRHAADLRTVRAYFAERENETAAVTWPDFNAALTRMTTTMERQAPCPTRESPEFELMHRRQSVEFAEAFSNLEVTLANRRGVATSEILSAVQLVLDPCTMIDEYFLDVYPNKAPSRLDVYDDDFVRELLVHLDELAPEYAGQARRRLEDAMDEAKDVIHELSGLRFHSSYSPLLDEIWDQGQLLFPDDETVRRDAITGRTKYGASRLLALQEAGRRVEALGPSKLRRVLLDAIARDSGRVADAIRDLPHAVDCMRVELNNESSSSSPTYSALEWARVLSGLLPRAGVSLEAFARLAGMAVVSVCDLGLRPEAQPAALADAAEPPLAIEHQPEFVLMPVAEPQTKDAAEVHSTASPDR